MDTNELISNGIELVEQAKYPEAIDQLNKALANITDKTTQIQEQNNAQHWLGYCYLEQAIQTKNTDLFNRARKHFQKRLELAEQLGGNDCIQQQNYAQSWLGYCFFQEATQTESTALLECALEHFQKQLQLAMQLGIESQANAEYWLGRYYLEKIKLDNSNTNSSEEYFNNALTSISKSTDKNLKETATNAIKHYLREALFLQKNYSKYLTEKEAYINKKLRDHLAAFKKPIASILTVLTIAPIEFGKPLAHYTSPSVCEKLLGIAQKTLHDTQLHDTQKQSHVSKMRMNSSAYMNDPYEGKSLLDYLDIQEKSLENLREFNSHNAFFTCFSSRVNDLNQFRLYGKVGNMEASGCCLVFNKNGDWIKEPDISASYQYLNRTEASENSIAGEVIKELHESLPLYQIAYIFYRDEYTKTDEHDVMSDVDNSTFGIRLKPISDNSDWHDERKAKLKSGLDALKNELDALKKKLEEQNQSSSSETTEQKQSLYSALEYIRYLFKDYAFRDEEEFRLLKVEEIGSDKVQYCPHTNSNFVEYGDVCGILDEVILGTNYEYSGDGRKVEVFRHLLKQKHAQIKVSHSSLPIHSAQK